jgi:aspartyl protease family protein
MEQGAAAFVTAAFLALVLASLIARRPAMREVWRGVAGWAAIFAVMALVGVSRDQIGAAFTRLWSDLGGGPVVSGRTVRVPMAEDGHFYIDGEIRGARVRFMVDSGASVTAIDRATAGRVGIAADEGMLIALDTANGETQGRVVRPGRIAIGPFERETMRVVILEAGGNNLLGMNFLSSLKGWRIEGRTLILEG